MTNRIMASIAALIVAVGGIALALNASAATAAEHEFPAADAGTVAVSVDGSTVAITDVVAVDGWQPEIEIAEGRQVEMDFRNGELRVKVNVELEDGELRVRVRERDGSDEVSDSETSIIVDDSGTTATTQPDDDDTTSTTMADHDDDNSDPGAGDDEDENEDDDEVEDDDEDNSGPGGSDDDEDEDDDEDDD